MSHTPPPTQETAATSFERLLTILETLRAECPWDKKQTMLSLRHLTIEEMYELTDAILDNDLEEVKKELGDVMMHLVFYAKIGSEQRAFDIVDVLNSVCDKLIHRHPHIYGDIKAEDEDAVKRNWEQIKLKEGKKSVLAGVPNGLPALVKAYRMQDKARGVGFDWDNPEDVWDKVEEELGEFKAEFNPEDTTKINMENAEAEFGDLLFSLINYARKLGINPENALERTNKKFKQRFTYLEQESEKDGKTLAQMSLAEMDVYWNRAKSLKP